MSNEKELEALLSRMTRLEAKMDLLIQVVAHKGDDRKVGVGSTTAGPLSRLTTKQHAALQMILAGKSNAEIAERFKVSTNTAKVYVRSIATKLGVNTRNQIVVALFDDFKNADPEEYLLISGGLPKDWCERYESPDPYKPLYATKTR